MITKMGIKYVKCGSCGAQRNRNETERCPICITGKENMKPDIIKVEVE